MEKFEVKNRPVLPDRIQVNVIPDYLEVYDTLNKKVKDEYDYLKSAIIDNAKLKNLSSKRFTVDDKFHYMVNLNSDLKYISDIKLNAICPFSISFKLNFIRLLNENIKSQNEFNDKYFKDILLDDDNFIDKNIWSKWNDNLIYYLLNSLNDNCLKIANDLLYSVVPYNNISYQKVTISQIETNIDYFVGCDNSLYLINLFSDFINSDSCIDFRKKIGETALKHKIPFELNDKYTKIDKNESVSIQFQICNGLFAKVYRKTKDHIRFELLFEKQYLRRKFKKLEDDISSSTDIKRIVKPVIEFSKDFFKDIDFNFLLKTLYCCSNHNYEVDHFSKSFDFFRQVNPEINDIISSINNNMPITDKNTMSFISKHPDFSKRFERVYFNNGKKYLIYKPDRLKNFKGKRLETPVKSKPDIKYKTSLFRCPRCDMDYRGDYCPNCSNSRIVSPREILWIGNKQYVRVEYLNDIL